MDDKADDSVDARPRGATRLTELLESLDARLKAALESSAAARDPHSAVTPDVEALINAAVAELARLQPAAERGKSAPVLGPGVAERIMRGRKGTVAPLGRSRIDETR